MDPNKQKDLVKAAAVAPHDDLPRLVYADLLEETGEPVHVARSYFIRAQCELESLEPTQCDRIAELKQLAKNLQAEFGQQWEDEFEQIVPDEGLNHLMPSFRRGFIDNLACTPRSWERFGQETCEAWPVTSITIEGDMRRFLQVSAPNRMERTGRLERVAIASSDDFYEEPESTQRNANNVRALLDALAVSELSPLPNLKELSLNNLHIGNDEAIELAGRKAISKLKVLEIEYNRLTNAGFAAILNSPNLSHMQALVANHSGIDDAALAQLADSAHMKHLNVLQVNYSRVGDEGVVRLAASPNADHLMELDVAATAMGTEGVRAIAQSAHMGNLRELRLSVRGIASEVAQELVNSEHMAKLEILDWNSSGMGSEAAVALANSARMSNLKELHLRYGEIGNDGAQAIAASPHLRGLQRLVIDNNGLSDSGVMAFVDCALPDLQYLNLGGSNTSAQTQVALGLAMRTPGNALFGMEFVPRLGMLATRSPEKTREAAALYEQRLAGTLPPPPAEPRDPPPHLSRRDRHGNPVPAGGGLPNMGG